MIWWSSELEYNPDGCNPAFILLSFLVNIQAHKTRIAMKKIFVLFALSLLMMGIKAQDSDIQTLFSGNTRISGLGGPTMSFTTVKGQFAHMMGGGGAVLLGDFWFGGYGEGLTNGIPAATGDTRLDFGHGGFWTGYSFMASRPLHPTLSAQIGWGTVGERDYGSPQFNTDNIFVFNPGLELEMNFTHFFRLGIGVHYRIVTGLNPELHTSSLSNSDFSGPGALLTFKFGWF